MPGAVANVPLGTIFDCKIFYESIRLCHNSSPIETLLSAVISSLIVDLLLTAEQYRWVSLFGWFGNSGKFRRSPEAGY